MREDVDFMMIINRAYEHIFPIEQWKILDSYVKLSIFLVIYYSKYLKSFLILDSLIDQGVLNIPCITPLNIPRFNHHHSVFAKAWQDVPPCNYLVANLAYL